MRVRNMTCGVIVGLAMMMAASANAQVPVVYENEPNHLECWQIRDVKDSTLYQFTVTTDPDDLILPANTIAKGCSLKRFSREYCVTASTSNFNPAPLSEADLSENGAVPDAFDYVCYNLRCASNNKPAPGTTTVIKDRFGEREVAVRKIKKICVPMIKKMP